VHEYEDEIILLKRKSSAKLESKQVETKDNEMIVYLQEEVTKYKKEIDSLNNQLGTRDQEIKQNEMRIKQIQSEIEELTQKLDQKENESKTNHEKMKESNLILQEKLEESNKIIMKLNEQLEYEQKKNVEYEKKLNQMITQSFQEQSQGSVQEMNESVLKDEEENSFKETESTNQGDKINLKEITAKVLNTRREEDNLNFHEDKDKGQRLTNIIAELSNSFEQKRADNQESEKEEDDEQVFLSHGVQSNRNTNSEENEYDEVYEEEQYIDDEDQTPNHIISMEEVIGRIQEENRILTEKYDHLLGMTELLGQKVMAVQEEKVILQNEIMDKDNKINLLEKYYLQLHEELMKLKRENLETEESLGDQEQDSSSVKLEKVLKINLSEDKHNLDTTHSIQNQSGSKAFSPKINASDLIEQAKSLSKSLYIKLKKNPLPTYLNLNEKNLVFNEQNEIDESSASFTMNHIFHAINSINLENIIKGSFESFLGKDLLFLIYGAKGSDKKHIKYRLLYEMLNMFKTMSEKKENNQKTFKMVIKIQDPIILEKAQLFQNTNCSERIEKPIEITFGDNKSEGKLHNYLISLRDIDFTKTKNTLPSSHWAVQGNPTVKQMVLEFIIEEKGEEGKVKFFDENEDYQTPKRECLFKSKVVLLTMNSETDPTATIPFEILMKASHTDKQKTLEKFLVLALNPTTSQESYQAVYQTLVLLRRLDNPTKSGIGNNYQTPNNEFDNSFSAGKENKNSLSDEKSPIPVSLRNLKIINDYLDNGDAYSSSHSQSINNESTRSIAINDQTAKNYKKGTFQEKVNKFFGFMTKWSKSKSEENTIQSPSDINSSFQNNSTVVKKLVDQLE